MKNYLENNKVKNNKKISEVIEKTKKLSDNIVDKKKLKIIKKVYGNKNKVLKKFNFVDNFEVKNKRKINP